MDGILSGHWGIDDRGVFRYRALEGVFMGQQVAHKGIMMANAPIDRLRLVVASITFGVWVILVIASLFGGADVPPGVHILTAAVFTWLFGPNLGKRLNGNGDK